MRLLNAFINPVLALMLVVQAPHSFASDPLIAKFSTSNVKPWGYSNEKGTPTGLLVELAKGLQDELASTGNNAIKIENRLRPYPRVIYEMEKGIVDFAVMFNSPEANKLGTSLGKVADSKVILVGLAGTPRINALNELKGKLIGHIRGSKYGKSFDNNQLIRKISFVSMEQGISMLLKGRIYALASADQTLYYALNELDIPSHEITPIMTISQISTALYFSKASKNTELIPPFTDALGRLKTKGVIDKIFHRDTYIPKRPSSLNVIQQ